MTDLERRIKAKIPGADTGIEIRRTMCDICSPGMHCGVNAYVKDGTVIKIEGMDGHPVNDGRLCTKGLANREYIYRQDRIRTPLKRVGKRGEGKFREISWDQAYEEIAAGLNNCKMQYGAESVAFYSGYSKWYRPTLRRLAYAFGSPNYGCESSACYTAAFMAWKLAAGDQANPDITGSDLFLGWAYNPFYSNYMSARRAMELKEKGLKFIIVDTRRTPATEKLADLFLQPKSGTDGALAHGIAHVLIERGWIDREYIDRYVYGFEEYAAYVSRFGEHNVEEITGVPYSLVVQAARMIHENPRMSCNESSAPLCHHRNGLQNYRSVLSLLAITGNFDRKGGQVLTPHTYMHVACGFSTREEAYLYEMRPKQAKAPVGAERFPLWNHLEGEMQAMDMTRQILEGTPYPLRAVFALGMNARMFPDSSRTFKALESLDFFVDTDLFLTDTARWADIVLPACSSFERGEFKPYAGGKAWYTSPAIEALGSARSDVQICTELARVMDLPDEVLKKGYDYFIQHYILDDYGVTIEELKKAELPVSMAPVEHHGELELVDRGLGTPTGKFELKSAVIEQHPEWELDALPTYREPLDGADPVRYPFVFTSGSRIPNALHSRLHQVPRNRSLRPEPTADMNRQDCLRLGVEEGDRITISTGKGSLTVRVHPTLTVPEGLVNLFHGYREADAESIMDGDHLDPYSGFPAYRSVRCAVSRYEPGEDR